MQDSASFGEWVRRRRRALDLTQAALADRASISIFTIRKIEADERRPSRQVAGLLAHVLGIQAHERELFLKVARGERATLALASLSATQDVEPRAAIPLPIPATPLIGRRAELEALAHLLTSSECRLVTITGPGGIGKTRLALEVATAQRAAFAHGAAFVPLAPVGAPEFIVPAMADALGLALHAPAQPETQLFDFLRAREQLLVVDNAEHLLAGAGMIAALLQQALRVKMLVTSRERLNLRGEWVVDLQGLPVPPEGQAAGLEAYGAVALFVDNARRARAGFTLTEANRAAVARICRLVEGMPLGIELAAAWVRALTCDDIANEIDRNLSFLATTQRDVPARHRSLRAAFDHSWRLLTDDERAVLSRLSVFRAGFTRHWAEQVAGASLTALSALVDKSLITGPEAGRYRQHELLRQYAASHLEADPPAGAAARERHYAVCVELAEAAEPELRGARQLEWLRQLEQEQDNLRAALDWSLAREDRGALRLAAALRWFWYVHGPYPEGLAWLNKALAKLPASSRLARARALEGVSLLAWRLGDYTTSHARADESKVLFRQLGDVWGLAGALTIAGLNFFDQGDMAAAHARFEEALALYRQVVDPWGIARGLCNLANSTLRLNGPEAARAMIEEAVPILEALGERFLLHTALYRLQVIELEMGRYATARALFERSLALAQDVRDQEGVQVAFIAYGRVLSVQGDYEAARSQLEAALAVWRECGGGVPLGVISAALLENDLATGDLSSARQRLAAGLSVGDKTTNRSLRAHALYCQGLLAYREGDLDGAAALLDGSTAAFREIQAAVGLGYALVALGRVLRAQGKARSAEALVRDGLSLLQQRHHKLGVATALEALGGLVADAHGEQAAMLFGTADAIRRAIGAPLPPIDRAAHNRDVASVSAQLDEIAFAQAWAEGQASPFEAIANAVLRQDAA